MNRLPNENDAPHPGDACARYADLLPLLTMRTPAADQPTGVERELAALRAHLPTCAYCRAQLAAYEAAEIALRRRYVQFQGQAPFLSFDAIARQVGATPASAFTAPALTAEEFKVADERDAADWLATSHRANYEANRATTRNHASVGQPYARRPRFVQGLLAIAAAIIIVALLGAVFYTLGANHRNAPVGQNRIPNVHYLGAKAKWQAQGPFAGGNIQYVFAQSDPQIVYKTAGNFLFQRSGDGGKTWQNLAPPLGDFPAGTAGQLRVVVSPVNPQILILTLGSGPTNPNCPQSLVGAASSGRHVVGGGLMGAITTSASALAAAPLSQTIPAAGGYSCSFQYISGNGGASWAKVHLPGDLRLGALYLQHPLNANGQISGSRLYAVTYHNANGSIPLGSRLMTSGDGGLTWRFADLAFDAQGWATYNVAVAPTGSTVLALTVPINANSGNSSGLNPTVSEFWRSDDAGAHWADLGPAPYRDKYGADEGLTISDAGGKLLIYSAVNNVIIGSATAPIATRDSTPDHVFVSVDDGHTWQRAPLVGIPTGENAIGAPLGTLSNGAIVFQFSKEQAQMTTAQGTTTYAVSYSNTAYYAWRPTTNAWQPLTALLLGSVGDFGVQWLTSAQSGQPETIWALAFNGQSYTLEWCALS